MLPHKPTQRNTAPVDHVSNRHTDANSIFSSYPIIRNALSRYGRILPAHVAIMMSMLKNIRASKNLLHTDSWVDGCGYSALGGELSQRMKDEIIQLEKKNES